MKLLFRYLVKINIITLFYIFPAFLVTIRTFGVPGFSKLAFPSKDREMTLSSTFLSGGGHNRNRFDRSEVLFVEMEGNGIDWNDLLQIDQGPLQGGCQLETAADPFRDLPVKFIFIHGSLPCAREDFIVMARHFAIIYS